MAKKIRDSEIMKDESLATIDVLVEDVIPHARDLEEMLFFIEEGTGKHKYYSRNPKAEEIEKIIEENPGVDIDIMPSMLHPSDWLVTIEIDPTKSFSFFVSQPTLVKAMRRAQKGLEKQKAGKKRGTKKRPTKKKGTKKKSTKKRATKRKTIKKRATKRKTTKKKAKKKKTTKRRK